MNKYRTHNCNELSKDDIGKNVKISGWLHRKRDHGNLLFIDLRDNYGITQCIIDKENSNNQMKVLTKIMKNILGNADLTDTQRCELHFTLGKMLEDLRDFSAAFEHYSKGGKLKKKMLKFQLN